jgi:hypothetical protein
MPPDAAQDRLDSLDLAILRLLTIEPRVGIREYARKPGVARGTDLETVIQQSVSVPGVIRSPIRGKRAQ